MAPLFILVLFICIAPAFASSSQDVSLADIVEEMENSFSQLEAVARCSPELKSHLNRVHAHMEALEAEDAEEDEYLDAAEEIIGFVQANQDSLSSLGSLGGSARTEACDELGVGLEGLLEALAEEGVTGPRDGLSEEAVGNLVAALQHMAEGDEELSAALVEASSMEEGLSEAQKAEAVTHFLVEVGEFAGAKLAEFEAADDVHKAGLRRELLQRLHEFMGWESAAEKRAARTGDGEEAAGRSDAADRAAASDPDILP